MIDREMEENHQNNTETLIPEPILNESPQQPHNLLHNYAQTVWIYHPSW